MNTPMGTTSASSVARLANKWKVRLPSPIRNTSATSRNWSALRSPAGRRNRSRSPASAVSRKAALLPALNGSAKNAPFVPRSQ